MNKTVIGLSAALAVSLLGHAWQLSQRDEKNGATSDEMRKGANTARAGSASPDKGRLDSGSSGGTGRNGQQGTIPGSLEEVLSINDAMARFEGVLAFVRSAPADQIPEIIESIRKRPGKKLDVESQLLTSLLLTRWGSEDAEAAFASLEGLSIKEGARDALTILSGLASVDPLRASEWLNAPDNRLAEQPWMAQLLARTIGEEWARQDPRAALAWAAELPDKQRRDALVGILGNVLTRDAAGAVALANGLTTADRDSIVGELAGAWARQSPEAAMSWLETFDGEVRSGAMAEVIRGWAASEPSQAASYLDRLDGANHDGLVGEIGRQWARQDPAEAARWLGSHPESSGRANAMGHVMWNWGSSDPQAAADWLGQLPSGASYDNGVAGFAKAAIHSFEDAEAGVRWAATIENDQLRESMVGHTLGRWMQQDQGAAEAWAGENGVQLPQGRAGGNQEGGGK